MAVKQFDVYQNPSRSGSGFAPYLVVLSSHHLFGFDEAIVAPLVNDADRVVRVTDRDGAVRQILEWFGDLAQLRTEFSCVGSVGCQVLSRPSKALWGTRY